MMQDLELARAHGSSVRQRTVRQRESPMARAGMLPVTAKENSGWRKESVFSKLVRPKPKKHQL